MSEVFLDKCKEIVTYQIHVQFLKLGSGESLAEVLARVEALDFDSGAHLRR